MLNEAAISSPAHDWRLEVPGELVGSRLLAHNGLLVVSGWIASEIVEGLSAEAASARTQSARGVVAASDGTEGRGGSPARAYRSAPGGRLHWALHASQELVDALIDLCGVTLATTGGGTYSYYERTGDFLAVHRDVLKCDVAVITSLTDATDFSAGGLLVYPTSLDAQLSEVRSRGRAAGTPVPLARGESAILLGGILPHEVTPMAGEGERVVAIMCYRLGHPDEGPK